MPLRPDPSDPEQRREAYRKRDEWRRRSKGLKRTGRLRRRSHLNREAQMKESNPARRRRRFRKAYESEERVQFFQRQGCVVCDATPCENAHTEAGGMGMKGPPESIVPLCAGPEGHHAELHRIGRETFEAKYKVDLAMYAEYWAGRWAKHTEDG